MPSNAHRSSRSHAWLPLTDIVSALIPSGLHGQAGPEAAPGQSPLQKNALMHTTLTKAVCGGYGYPMRLAEAVRFAAMTYKTIRLQAGYSVMYHLLVDSALKVQ